MMMMMTVTVTVTVAVAVVVTSSSSSSSSVSCRCRLLASEDGRCPMCSEKVKMEEVQQLSDVMAILHLQQDAVE